MKNLFSKATILTAIVVATTFSAFAQSSIRATVPFDFQVGNTQMKAGVYSIRAGAVNSSDVLQIQDHSGKVLALISGVHLEAPLGNRPSHLLFNKYGERYFLSHIWRSESQSGIQLLKGSDERASLIARTEPSVRMVAAGQ